MSWYITFLTQDQCLKQEANHHKQHSNSGAGGSLSRPGDQCLLGFDPERTKPEPTVHLGSVPRLEGNLLANDPVIRRSSCADGDFGAGMYPCCPNETHTCRNNAEGTQTGSWRRSKDPPCKAFIDRHGSCLRTAALPSRHRYGSRRLPEPSSGKFLPKLEDPLPCSSALRATTRAPVCACCSGHLSPTGVGCLRLDYRDCSPERAKAKARFSEKGAELCLPLDACQPEVRDLRQKRTTPPRYRRQQEQQLESRKHEAST